MLHRDKFLIMLWWNGWSAGDLISAVYDKQQVEQTTTGTTLR